MLLTIDKIVAGGPGLGRLADGCTVLVPGVLPGEQVRVVVRRRHRRFLEAELRELLVTAPERRRAPCPYYDRCGGCDLQHAVYPAQLTIKQQILRELIERAGLAPRVLPALRGPLPAPAEFNYRQRIRLQVEDNRGGFFQAGSRRLQPVEACLLARPEINTLWQQLQRHQAWRRLAPRVGAVEINLDPATGLVVLLLHHQRRPRPAERSAALQLCLDLPLLKGLAFMPAGHAAGPFFDRSSGPEGRPGPAELELRLRLPVAPAGRELELAVEPWGFSQVNEEQNRQLLALLIKLLQPAGREVLADLHCGMGNFSLPLALLVGEVHGVDLQAAAIRGAKRNARANRIDNCHFTRADARQGLSALRGAGIRPEILLLDPPRAGCRELIASLAEPLPPRIVMISCDPATMVRDLGGLLALNYRVEAMRLVDMFPQTHHLETITLLSRNPG